METLLVARKQWGDNYLVVAELSPTEDAALGPWKLRPLDHWTHTFRDFKLSIYWVLPL